MVGTTAGTMDSDKIWMGYGNWGVEGVAGAIIEQQKDGIAWIKHLIPNFYLTDALYLGTDIIAAGGLIKGNSVKGTILHSNDQGRTWVMVYMSKKPFSKLMAVDENCIWALGEDGSLVRLTK
jgi:photosystem II stability/assembly factor-like uncharacterized protein